jgi:hypothetical protein
MNDPKTIDGLIAFNEQRAHELTSLIGRAASQLRMWGGQTYYAARLAEIQAEKTANEERLAATKKALAEYNALYTGWTRAFLVVNSNGHIHKSRDCSTCFETTQYYWMYELSGEDELAIAQLAGEKACTVCYSEAPSSYFMERSQLEHPDVVKAREERAAKKAEREAKRLAVGVFNVDGTPLKVHESSWSRYKSEIKTERTAESIAVQHYLWLADDRERNLEELTKVTEALTEICEALARKRGTDYQTEYDKIEVKGLKKQIEYAKANAKWLEQNPQYKKLV